MSKASTKPDARARAGAAQANGSAANGVDEIVVHAGSLTIDEMDLIYEVTGAEIEDIEAGTAKVPGRVMLRAFALLALRRANPDATIADSGGIDVDGINRMLGERPTRAAGPPDTSSSASSPKRRGSRSSGSRG